MERQTMSKSAKRELARAQHERYQSAGKKEKSRILDEFVQATGYNRRYAMAVLKAPPREPKEAAARKRRHTYTCATLKALEKVWSLSGRLCSKRMVPFLPEFLIALEEHGEMSLDAFTRSQLLTLSAATMDRHLATVRRNARHHGLSLTRAGDLLKSQIPIRTFADWEDAVPGFFEADLVVHTNDGTGGDYLCTLVLTDVCLGWTECRPLLHHTQTAVKGAIKDIRGHLPYPLLGIDTDNGSEFINRQLLLYCQTEGITFTRGRARKKNDQCKVEQKNGHIVRSLVGYGRYDGMHAFQRLAALYHYGNPWVNFFQPSMKLLEKHRDGAKVTKRYDEAKTPYRRALESEESTEECKAALKAVYRTLNPVALQRLIQEKQQSLWTLAKTPPFPTTESQIPK